MTYQANRITSTVVLSLEIFSAENDSWGRVLSWCSGIIFIVCFDRGSLRVIGSHLCHLTQKLPGPIILISLQCGKLRWYRLNRCDLGVRSAYACRRSDSRGTYGRRYFRGSFLKRRGHIIGTRLSLSRLFASSTRGISTVAFQFASPALVARIRLPLALTPVGCRAWRRRGVVRLRAR